MPNKKKGSAAKIESKSKSMPSLALLAQSLTLERGRRRTASLKKTNSELLNLRKRISKKT